MPPEIRWSSPSCLSWKPVIRGFLCEPCLSSRLAPSASSCFSTPTHNGFSSSTYGVTAMQPSISFASWKWRIYFLNSSSRKMVSTVVRQKRSPRRYGERACRLCMELGVVFTTRRRGTGSFICSRCSRTAVLHSLTITTISVAPQSTKMRRRRSIIGSPHTGTRGLGCSTPSCANRLPSPAAITANLILSISNYFYFSSISYNFLL